MFYVAKYYTIEIKCKKFRDPRKEMILTLREMDKKKKIT